MSEEKKNPKEVLTDHDYDGIHELDNDLPRWWLASFYITIVFAVIYFLYYEIGSGPSIQQEFEQEVAMVDSARKAAAPQTEFPDMKKLEAIGRNPGKLAEAKQGFQSRCASCHGDKAQGLIGPNLTDDHWINGDGKTAAIAKVIFAGVAEKGMPPWGSLLSEDEIYALASYVKSLRGSKPPGAKVPQGALIRE